MAGIVHPCPFSHTGSGKILEEDLESICEALSKEECINCNIYKDDTK